LAGEYNYGPDAHEAAAKLARQHVGEVFVVLAAKRACCVEGPETWVDCE
jgi:hypothetical protein